MNTKHLKFNALLGSLLLLAPCAAYGEELSLVDYLNEVKANNKTYSGTVEKSKGSEGRAREKDVMLSPVFFASITSQWNAQPPMLPLYTYDRFDFQNYTVGVMQQTRIGLNLKLSYQLDRTSYSNLAIFTPQGYPLSFNDMRPVIEASFPLWQNGFGRGIRNNLELIDAGSKAEKYVADAQSKGLILAAEQTYWRLVAAREVVRITERALQQSQTLYDYIDKRVKMNLTDKSDLLQATAALQSRQLEFKMAQNEEKAATRMFNSLRNESPETVPTEISAIPWETFSNINIPKSFQNRADVQAALQQAKALAAKARLAQENDKPKLDVFGSYSLGERTHYVSSTFPDPYVSGRSATMVGVQFSMPLNFYAVSDAKQGAVNEEHSAELVAQQKLLDQEAEWNNLVSSLKESQENLNLAQTIVNSQKQKLENERIRLKQGRSTTYQVLLFEQDCIYSELNLTRTGTQILMLLAQLKLYEGEQL